VRKESEHGLVLLIKIDIEVVTVFCIPVCFLLLSILSAMAGTNSYFVPGFGISRAVIQSEIRYHCGPDAIVRPYTHQVGPTISGCTINILAARLI
jgi:hypothetical protein